MILLFFFLPPPHSLLPLDLFADRMWLKIAREISAKVLRDEKRDAPRPDGLPKPIIFSGHIPEMTAWRSDRCAENNFRLGNGIPGPLNLNIFDLLPPVYSWTSCLRGGDG